MQSCIGLLPVMRPKRKDKSALKRISSFMSLIKWKMVREDKTYTIHEISVIVAFFLKGWWFVSFDQKEGWAPNSYLESIHGSIDRSSPSLHRGSPILTRTLRTSPPPTGSSSGHTSPDEFGKDLKVFN